MTINLSPLRHAIQDESGNLVNGATVTVRYEAGGALVPQCLSRLAVSKGNPFVAADGGDLDCYLLGGRYRIDAEKDGFSRTWRDVQVGTMQAADFVSQWLPSGDWVAETTFSLYAFVQYNRANYVSNQADNLDHEPPVDEDGKPISDAWWTFVPAAGFVRFIFFIGGRPRPGIGKGEHLFRIVFKERVVFPANLAGAAFKASDAAAAETVWSFEKNATEVATATWGATDTEATFTTAGGEAVTFDPDDVLDIYAPEARDATLAGIGCWLAAFPY